MSPLANHTIVGILLTDGTTTASNVIAATMLTGSGIDLLPAVRGGTMTSLQATVNVAAGTNHGSGHPWTHMRLRWTAANSFTGEFSPDGVTWSAFGIAGQSFTMTPTHFGVGVTSNGSALHRIISFEYLRRS